MEEEPGGLSEGECSRCNEDWFPATLGTVGASATVSIAAGGAACTNAAAIIECVGWTSLWQQECDAGISIEPH
jgi:hypothetical protein